MEVEAVPASGVFTEGVEVEERGVAAVEEVELAILVAWIRGYMAAPGWYFRYSLSAPFALPEEEE